MTEQFKLAAMIIGVCLIVVILAVRIFLSLTARDREIKKAQRIEDLAQRIIALIQLGAYTEARQTVGKMFQDCDVSVDDEYALSVNDIELEVSSRGCWVSHQHHRVLIPYEKLYEYVRGEINANSSSV